MTAEEYINSSRYSRLPGIYVLVSLKSNLPKAVCYEHCITNDYDGRIIEGLPYALDFQFKHRKEFFFIVKRLDKFFSNMFQNVDYTANNRELVNLRININLIYKTSLSKEYKLQWADWIKELYWNRKALLNQWYINNVLPF